MSFKATMKGWSKKISEHASEVLRRATHSDSSSSSGSTVTNRLKTHAVGRSKHTRGSLRRIVRSAWRSTAGGGHSLG
jgi:RNase P protein component